ncbi:oligosaccharide flippase family protein [Mesonia aestuariivivens]|uniref:Oligosaccharide flippase family protein n=1 Tax=Mesonia aestuariivivens TaxID=2796128 RepID=A0ABS6W0Z7_9FLAO|nr:oligosaccharide flippase family protein [Mesonia aestuariivivens]MBW2961527.1 oligosaccharide flippase family protein [Mesonia aestuariivivens]
MVDRIKKIFFSSQESKQITLNTFWSFTGTFFSRGLTFLGWVLVARILGKELNGEIGIVRSTINLFLIFVGSGLGLTATRYISKYSSVNKLKSAKIVSLTLITTSIFAVIVSSLLFVFASQLSEILNAPSIVNTIQLGAFLLFFGAFNSSLKGCIEGFQLFKISAIINTIFSIFLLGGLYFGAKNNTVYSTFFGFLIASLIYFVLQLITLFKILNKRKLRLTINLKEVYPILLKFTIPAILSAAMVIPFKWMAEALLVNQKDGYDEMGLFSAIILFQSLLYTVAQTLNSPLITLMSKKGKNFKLDKISLLLPWLIGIFGALPFILFPELFGIIFSKEYTSDSHFLNTYLIILLSTVIVLYKQGIARIMVVKDLMWFSFLDNFIWGITLIISFYFLAFKGAYGLSLSYLIAYITNIVIILPLYLKWKLIPQFLVKSPLTLLIWAILILIVSMNIYYEVSIILRFVIFIISSLIFIYLFYRLFKHQEN